MTTYTDLPNQLGNSSDFTHTWHSVSGSVSSDGAEYGNQIAGNSNVLQRQYSLIHKSYSDYMKKKKVRYCCANERTRPWILRISFLIVIALGLTISYLEIRFSTYSSKITTLTTGDQLLLPISTFFNGQVKFHADSKDSGNLRLYVLRNMPDISSEVNYYDSGVKFHMPSWSFQYWGFYLLAGTSVKISVCVDLQIQFYIIRGKKKLRRWTQQILYNSYDFHNQIFPKPSCDKLSNYKTHILTVTKSDYYYILFSTSNGWRFFTEVSVLLQFNRTYYDLSNLKYTCMLSNMSCAAHLDVGSMDISLVEAVVPAEPISPFHNIKLKYVPVPCHDFHLKIFGGIYLVILVLSAIYIIWRVSVNQSHLNTEKEPLVSSRISNLHYNVANPEEKPWVVVSNITRLSSKETVCQMEERETGSILEDESLNNYMIDSVNSRDFMRQQNEVANNAYTNPYNNTQQLLDTCLTSAGASAI